MIEDGKDITMTKSSETIPPKRSSGALKQRRRMLSWPKGKDFKILSIDGGGIRGIFPAAFLSGLEQRYLDGSSVTQYFDLISSTSTGGIIALGLAAGLTATDMNDLYVKRGREIFPPDHQGFPGTVGRWFKNCSRFLKFSYDREALVRVLCETFSEKKFGEAKLRLCIPAFDGRYGETYIFKTPHHPDFKMDYKEKMTKVATATSAAPTFYRPFEDGGYTFVDGGVWANNPIMVGLVDVLSCFDVPRDRVRILSIGCGDDPYVVGKFKTYLGGLWAWRDIIHAAMRLQSLNAIGQAGLLIGANRVMRINPPLFDKKIKLDDWRGAVTGLPDAAEVALDQFGQEIEQTFLSERVIPYQPFH